jgi:GntR family transcriptional regulator
MERPASVQGLRFQPIDTQASMPAYLQIARAIKEVLRAGHMPPGTPLPPERALCEQFGVSRMTMRQANHVLEREGLIERHPGRGTFVALHRFLKREYELRSFSEDISARGARPCSTVHSFRTIHPDLASAEFFGLPRSESLYEIQRVRFSDDTPIAFDTAELPCFLCRGLDHFNLADHSLYQILEEHYGIQFGHSLQEISAARPSRLHLRLLHMPASAAVLVVKRKTYTTNNTPIELSTTTYRGDLYTASVVAVRTRKDQGVEMTPPLPETES